MINLTENAAKEILRQMESRGSTDQFVRIGVDTGGCSGMQYTVDFTAEKNSDDSVFENGDVKVVCDSISLVSINGLTIDFVDALVGVVDHRREVVGEDPVRAQDHEVPRLGAQVLLDLDYWALVPL